MLSKVIQYEAFFICKTENWVWRFLDSNSVMMKKIKNLKGGCAMKEQFITITGFNHYYGIAPFKLGKKIACVKEPENPFDSEAIRCQIKGLGKVGYVANSVYTVAAGTKSAGGIAHKVKKKFKVEVMFITGHCVICKVVDGLKEKKATMQEIVEDDEPVSFN